MRGHVVKRGEAAWSFVVDAPLGSPEAKRKREWHSGYRTRKEAEAALAEHLHNRASGGYTEPTRETVGSFAERWLRDYASANLEARTYERYVGIVQHHIIPALGQVRITSLRPSHILAAERGWLESGRVNGRGGLSVYTVLKHHRLLREMLQHAIKWQVIAHNPADAVEPPRPAGREMRILSREQAMRLLGTCEGSEFGVPIFVALQTGLRVGELLGLRWADVDFDGGALRIRQALKRLKGGTVTFGSPKTHRSRRAVSIPPTVVDVLRQHRYQQVEHRLQLGPTYNNRDLVFADPLGEPIHERRLRREFDRMLKAADLPPIRLHDLRHTMASLMLAQGVHPKIVSERLGHATVGITLDLYSHTTPNLQAEAAKQLDEWLRAPQVARADPS